jgi:hypothetical protein
MIGRSYPYFLKLKTMKVKFKQTGITLNVKGFSPINEGNLTVAIYQRLVEFNPNLAELFEVEEEVEE